MFNDKHRYTLVLKDLKIDFEKVAEPVQVQVGLLKERQRRSSCAFEVKGRSCFRLQGELQIGVTLQFQQPQKNYKPRRIALCVRVLQKEQQCQTQLICHSYLGKEQYLQKRIDWTHFTALLSTTIFLRPHKTLLSDYPSFKLVPLLSEELKLQTLISREEEIQRDLLGELENKQERLEEMCKVLARERERLKKEQAERQAQSARQINKKIQQLKRQKSQLLERNVFLLKLKHQVALKLQERQSTLEELRTRRQALRVERAEVEEECVRSKWERARLVQASLQVGEWQLARVVMWRLCGKEE